MEGFLMLFMLSLTMFFGSYISGSVPLAMSFSESKLRLVTVFGAGLLVGTALAVIIPEGVQSIYEAQSREHSRHAAQLYNPSQAQEGHAHLENPDEILQKVPMPDSQKSGQKPPAEKLIPQVQGAPPPDKPPVLDSKQTNNNQSRKKREVYHAPRTKRETHQEHGHEHHAAHDGLHHHEGLRVDNLIGIALVVGFIFMLCVDQISHSHQRHYTGGDPLQPRYKITATVGLVVHAAADGIALGAASTTNMTGIQFIVFLAIMLHKAPAAFGLTTFLLYEGLEPTRIRRHLLVFSLAAPTLAIVTFIGIIKGGSATLSSLTTTGVLMLFSAGTFLYVATVHVLPEIVQQGSHAPPQHQLLTDENGTLESGTVPRPHSHGNAAFKMNELLALISGAVVPIFLSLGHSHGH